ncbi:monosaccharide ABC transporter ATP-binding protein (CUT2 family) [Anaerobacterium chartisolvens]|uniref:Monosaccharide ABC transporter ATP-binding protein (CUT2 family) n=1 Tax=Anaerobacterium chartisolvens TaxID=1297424 RepID=A0A369BCV3_9FIRM|nr:sugar ABC transporter ATP-binding protein [Anaerobacterium chartisolvens]RCX19363.1 monosaccharide ABC transporter ATP-binding protein (CUT2 family) [Anaerobacterium chartisolvens]
MKNAPKLELRGVEKSFPGVKALSNVNFSVKKGTVHVLCGENGAGKSTLMKIINGIHQPDAGHILIDGEEVKIHNPIEARKCGISMIFQELNYIPEITIEQNMFLGSEPLTRLGSVDWREIRRRTLELMKSESLQYSPDTRLKDLTVSDIQMLEILKAISYDSDIIIMDEPTSAITNREVEVLFKKIGELKSKGVSIIYISHKMEEIFRIADDITVMRDGSVVDTLPADELDIDTVISMMVGRKITNVYPKEKLEIGNHVLEVQDLTCGNTFRNVSFNLRAGEIIGFAGLMGAGRTEVARAIFGLDPYTSGKIKIKGKEVKVRAVNDSIKNGLVMLSEDRKRYGIVPIRSIRENVSLPNLKQFIKKGRLHTKKEKNIVKSICERMRVKAPTLDTTVDALSGGNQQKVVLAKWMLRDPDILILDEPTRGIDVGAKYEIYKLMTELAHEKKAVIMISSELPELLGMCDRIYVMSKGAITGEIKRECFSQELVMKYATGTLTSNEVK